MNLKALAFRFRSWILAALYLVGFLAPWERPLRRTGTGSLWLASSTLLARTGSLSLAASTQFVTLTALFCCFAGAALRVWGTAYLGGAVIQDQALRGERMVTEGPYRWLRNPLYLGQLLFAVGVSILMPVTGALFFLVAVVLFQQLLITSEESYLTARLGETYRDYSRRIPRLLPRVPPSQASLPASGERPRWLQAVLTEIFPVGFALCFAVLAWRFNALILIRCLLVCYGLSLIGRALRPSFQRI
jgi:protein-S-isoprenylcysteine O-methyltransferase Ste14